jgi:hypothetical protein
MRRTPIPTTVLACAALAIAPAVARPQESPHPGPTGDLSLAGGTELGLESGKSGLVEVAATAGWELGTYGLRPEVGLVAGFAPDGHVALRPGISWSVPGYPFRLRVAADVANARDSSFGWRWILVGGGAELRLTGRLAFGAGVDLGVPLAGEAGVPLLFRVGSSVRF